MINKNLQTKLIKPVIVAEHCCNHMGDFNFALEMIQAAKDSGATYAKFQKWNASEALKEDHYNAPHPNSMHSFGEPYGKHRENLEFSIDQHKEIQKFCNEIGIGYSSSVFDCSSAREVASLNPDFIKIPSQKNTNLGLYPILCNEFDGDIHVSTGMTTEDQLDTILAAIDKETNLNRVVIYTTTSCYPCTFEDLHLLRINSFDQKYSDMGIKALGFSGHHNGIAADIAALSLGARYFERHFTLDRTLKGTDHAASLEPQGLKKLVRDINNVDLALTLREKNTILESEKEAYEKVKAL